MTKIPFNPDNALGDGIYGLPHSPEEAEVVLLPVPWEATASYGTGTAAGPAAILEASPHLDLLDRETGTPWEAGIAMLSESAEVAAWNREARALAEPVLAARHPGGDAGLLAKTARVNELGGQLNHWVYDQASTWLDREKLVGVVGGDHAVPFGLIRAAAERHPGMGILHMDAHCDLRLTFEGFTWSHGSVFRNVMDRLDEVSRLVQVGIRDYCREEMDYVEAQSGRVHTVFDADLRRGLQGGASWDSLVDPVIAELPETVYVSFDIDGLEPSLCPHTGTPVPGGLGFSEATSLLRKVAETGRRVVGFDLCEVAPDPTGLTRLDAVVGARVLYKLIGFALLSRPGADQRR